MIAAALVTVLLGGAPASPGVGAEFGPTPAAEPAAAVEAVAEPAPVAEPATEPTPAAEPELAWPGYVYVAHTVPVSGHHMRYVESGSGDPILMLHGLPSQGYLWRNVIDGVADHGRVIVPDLMGYGKSYQGPDLQYDARSQQAHFDAFMDAMDLRDLTLVVNDVGSMLGLSWAFRHPDRVKGIVLIEAVMLDSRSWWKHLPLKMKLSIRLMQNPRRARKMIVDRNIIIDKGLAEFGVRRDLSADELAVYRAPFVDLEVRERVLMAMGPSKAAVGGRSKSPDDSAAIINAYAEWLRDTQIPKLLLYAKPGLIAGRSAVRQAEKTFTNLESVSLGRGAHFLPEDHPDAIAEAIATFVDRL